MQGIRGCSSVDRASAYGAEGRGFESPQPHQITLLLSDALEGFLFLKNPRSAHFELHEQLRPRFESEVYDTLCIQIVHDMVKQTMRQCPAHLVIGLPPILHEISNHICRQF